eukprot:TRINITY_DN28211_c0_g1_i1.p1 TRINITY_DN28211_c0_g1~~TRINITY_DN28211_c0_g1_i1.p1  ORF type:complete len:367 (+),score=103.40 TRINITY_DN28211_c0_g1_i1:80-1180(+)
MGNTLEKRRGKPSAQGGQPGGEEEGARIDTILTQSAEFEPLGRVGGGSCEVRKVRDKATGRLWAVKRRPNPQQCVNEQHAAAIYRHFGAAVPETIVYQEGGVTVIVQAFLESTTLQAMREQDAGKARAAEEVLGKHFAIDCLLANWDVIGGRGGDNICIDAEGVPWRIDNAGCFGLRAQGEPKDRTGWSPAVTELFLMRDPEGGNIEAARTFQHVTSEQLAGQISELVAAGEAPFAALPPADKAMCLARVAYMRDWVQDTFGVQVDAFRGAALSDPAAAHAQLLSMGFDQDAVEAALAAAGGAAELALQFLQEAGAAPRQPAGEAPPADYSAELAQLTAMGFGEQAALSALQQAGGNVQVAVGLLS